MFQLHEQPKAGVRHMVLMSRHRVGGRAASEPSAVGGRFGLVRLKLDFDVIGWNFASLGFAFCRIPSFHSSRCQLTHQRRGYAPLVLLLIHPLAHSTKYTS